VKTTLRSINSTYSNKMSLSKGLEAMAKHVNEQDGDKGDVYRLFVVDYQ